MIDAMEDCRGCQARDKTIELLEKQVAWLQGQAEKAIAAPLTPPPASVQAGTPAPAKAEALDVRDANGRRYCVLADGLLVTRDEFDDANRMLNDMVNGRPPYPIEGTEGPGTGGVV